MQRVYAVSTLMFSLTVCLLGIAMVVATLARGGGPLSLGVVVGLGFAVFGAGRLYLTAGGGT